MEQFSSALQTHLEQGNSKGQQPLSDDSGPGPGTSSTSDNPKDSLPSFLPSLSLPKSGGAIRSIGDKFQANPVLGNGSTSIPIFTTPGRSEFGPQISLAYDTGSGNGPFGFGWHLSLPHISRRTDKGIPRYQDADDSDTFVLSSGEDLVPTLIQTQPGQWSEPKLPTRTVAGVEFCVRRYRPRVEQDFTLIERWTSLSTGDVHWRSITGENVTTIYGRDTSSRIYDPAEADRVHPLRIFTWLPSGTFDDKGNAMMFRYLREDSRGLDLTKLNEQNRNVTSRGANRYLKRILYGNNAPRGQKELFAEQLETDWMFEVVLDYGEHDQDNPIPNEPGVWKVRKDPFSSFKSGFEVRTYRLCRRILMFHHFKRESIDENCLVRSTDFAYRDQDSESIESQTNRRMAAFVSAVTQSGYLREGSGYHKESLPKVEFQYSVAKVEPEVRTLDSKTLENVPEGLYGTSYRWIDLDGEGICGIFSEQAGEWFYNSNSGDGVLDPLQKRTVKPSFSSMSSNKSRNMMDLSGDGKLDLVQFSPSPPGFFKRKDDDEWEPYKPFESLPNIRWDDANMRFVDLTGDGLADILITENEQLTWYASYGEHGFSKAEHMWKPHEDEHGPRLVFSDPTESTFLADMSGDGLFDLVHVKQGEVYYYPSLGYGRFGPKVSMDDAPIFEDDACSFQPRRIRLADIDGSGTTDIVYTSDKGFQIFFNLAGNGWTTATTLLSPPLHELVSVDAIDLFGNGTCCLVWSSPLPSDFGSQMRYIDLMGGTKPHLLTSMKNNMGSETSIEYAASTKFYLNDKRKGNPWFTKVPFPLQVVKRVSSIDHITGNKFSTKYKYHHGYFDPHEREFQGFGMVEQWNSEAITSLNPENLAQPESMEEVANVPPVLTRSWFHTGSYEKNQGLSNVYEQEYYREPTLSDADIRDLRLPDTILPNRSRFNGSWITYKLQPFEAREACRSLKGSLLRQEVYSPSSDQDEQLGDPYLVTELNQSIEIMQPRKRHNSHPVFLVSDREKLNFQYDAQKLVVNGVSVQDPRVTHSITLETNEYGQRTSSVTIGYGRRKNHATAAMVGTILTDEDATKQTRLHIVASQVTYTKAVSDVNDLHYRLPARCEMKTYEILNISPERQFFNFDEIRDKLASLPDIPSETWNSTSQTASQRLIDQSQVIYRKDDLSGRLSFGEQQFLGLRYDDYKLAFSAGLLKSVFVDSGKIAEASVDDIMHQGGYVQILGHDGWWTPSGRTFFSSNPSHSPSEELAEARKHFFLTHRFRSPFDSNASPNLTFRYDAYSLLLEETVGSTGNRVTVGVRKEDDSLDHHGHDYRTLQPLLIMDPNRNQSAVTIDALGMVIGTAAMGKPPPASAEGDDFVEFQQILTHLEVEKFFQTPLSEAPKLLQHASTRLIYDLSAYSNTAHLPHPKPVQVASLVREKHHTDSDENDDSKIQISITYSDGFGREIQHKTRAEDGKAPKRDTDGRILVENGLPVMTAEPVTPRWCGSGWTLFNNKGDPVKQYEPFFSDSHAYDFDVRIGHSPTFFYDPLQRVVATLNADNSWTKNVIGPWESKAWDEHDTVEITDLGSDKDVGKYFKKLPGSQNLKTWYSQRISGDLGLLKQRAARLAQQHADTPNVAHFDSLGRDLVTIKHNKRGGVDELITVRPTIDVEGNQREVFDQAVDKNGQLGDRLVERCNFDLLGNRIHRESLEAGAKWMLRDIAGNSMYTWDTKGQTIRNQYDELRRPIKSWVKADVDSSEILIEETTFGDADSRQTAADPLPELHNLKGMVVRIRDQAGEVEFQQYDFKGNALTSQRKYAEQYKEAIDWRNSNALGSAFTSTMVYDAISRVTSVTLPGGNVIRNTFNDASLLEKVSTTIPGVGTKDILSSVDYDAKGQRLSVSHGNGVKVKYRYNPLTYALEGIITWREPASFPNDCPQPPPPDWPGCQIQSLSYTLDAVGNVVHIVDDAQQTLFFDNVRIDPSNSYEYDPLYRLIKAGGREHLGQVGQNNIPSPFNISEAPLQDPRNGNAMGRYVETYKYDRAGNLLKLKHDGSNSSTTWVRNMSYSESSSLESDKFFNNQLTSTSPGSGLSSELYKYDARGNCASMPHLSLMKWDYKDQLRATSKMVTNNGTPETTRYVYDAKGQRVRKVTERSASGTELPKIKKERYYLGLYELYQEFDSQEEPSLRRETLHLSDSTQRVAIAEMLKPLDGTSASAAFFRYQYSNHINSSTLELDGSGNKISYEEYYPFGSTCYYMTAVTDVPKRYRFSAKERDEESGFYYFGARFYMPWAGRWINCDPGGLGDGLNLYCFVRCNPITLVDPNGRDVQKWLKRGVGALQLVGGAMEVAAGVGGVMTANPVGIGLGVLAIGHGLDSLAAGYRTLRDDEISNTYTQEGATSAARAMGASPETAEKIGMGVDFVAGVGPSMGVSIVKSTTKTAATEGITQAVKQSAPTAFAHSSSTAVAPKAIAATTSTEAAVHAAPEAAPQATTYAVESASPKAAEKIAEHAVPEATEQAVEHAAPEVAAQTAEHVAPEAAAQVTAQAAKPLATQAPAKVVTVLSQGQLRKMVVDAARKAITKQRDVLRQVIKDKNVAYLNRLGITNPKTVASLLAGPSNRRYAMIFGNALERMVARSFRSNPLLSQHIRWISNLRGFAPGGSRPDFLIRIGNMTIIADLTTVAARAKHLARPAFRRPLVWVYVR